MFSKRFFLHGQRTGEGKREHMGTEVEEWKRRSKMGLWEAGDEGWEKTKTEIRQRDMEKGGKGREESDKVAGRRIEKGGWYVQAGERCWQRDQEGDEETAGKKGKGVNMRRQDI